jgi:hypothetical protein
LSGSNAVENVSVAGNVIDSAFGVAGVRVTTFVAGSVLGNVPVSGLTISSNHLVNGIYGVAITKNPSAAVLSNVTVSGNTYYGQASSEILSDYEGRYQFVKLTYPGAPGTGTWGRGSTVLYTDPSIGGYIGAVCTTGGTPGVWRVFGHIGTVNASVDVGDPLDITNPNGRLGADSNGLFIASDTANKAVVVAAANGAGVLTTSAIFTATGGEVTGTWAANGGSGGSVVCWKPDGKTLGYATVAEITAGTCH